MKRLLFCLLFFSMSVNAAQWVNINDGEHWIKQKDQTLCVTENVPKGDISKVFSPIWCQIITNSLLTTFDVKFDKTVVFLRQLSQRYGGAEVNIPDKSNLPSLVQGVHSVSICMRLDQVPIKDYSGISINCKSVNNLYTPNSQAVSVITPP
jgi:hypothetical protein